MAATPTVPFAQIPELRGPIYQDNKIILFIRNASHQVTPIWYKYVIGNRKWYWTPYAPNWHYWISVNELVVPDGFWKNQKPALCNIKIIEFLAKYQPIPPQFASKL